MNRHGETGSAGMQVLSPATLEEALRLRTERPEATPIQGGTDVMVALNLGRLRPPALIDLSRVPELRGWSRANGQVYLGSGVTYTQLMEPPLREALPALAEAARTVGSPQVRNRGTIGGCLAAASPAGDAVPPLLVEGAQVELASVRGSRLVPVSELVARPKATALAPDELILRVRLHPRGVRETFMKTGGRNAMVRSVVSVALAADAEREELRVAFGSAGMAVGLVTGSLTEAGLLPERVADAARPIDDVRGTAAYRRHALRILTGRALARCLS